MATQNPMKEVIFAMVCWRKTMTKIRKIEPVKRKDMGKE
jgi:hypothetical protein